MTLRMFLRLPNCNVFNLQYGDVLDEINNFNNKKNKLMKIEDLDLYNDFEGVAAFLKSLDMFVTISNSTAHLAGSLGVKTILIKPDNYALFHYWNQKNNKTPWYNCVELIDKESFLKGSTNFSKLFKIYDLNLLERYSSLSASHSFANSTSCHSENHGPPLV